MVVEWWNVEQQYHIFMKILRFRSCEVFGINVLNNLPAGNMGIFKFAK
jgi:hypothetical protein